MDQQLIVEKLESLRRSLERVKEKCPTDLEDLLDDFDAQDIVTLNLSRAVQMSVDIGSHLISQWELPAPDTMGQVFDLLFQKGVLDEALALRMKKAVGFRNLAMHNYGSINWTIVHTIAKQHLVDFENFAKSIIKAANLEN